MNCFRRKPKLSWKRWNKRQMTGEGRKENTGQKASSKALARVTEEMGEKVIRN